MYKRQVLGGPQQQAAPARAHVEEALARPQPQFAADVVELGFLGLRQVHALSLIHISGWQDGSVTVNGVSANQGSAWNVADARDSIGYAPQDDVQKRLR